MPLITEQENTFDSNGEQSYSGYINDYSGSSNSNNNSGMWITAIFEGLSMGQENTMDSRDRETARQNQLANVLFRDRGNGSGALVGLGILAVVGVIIFFVLKSK